MLQDVPYSILFIPGGPGLNSNPERHLIPEDILKNSRWLFWNEPKETPKHGPYQFVLDDLIQAVNSIREPLLILAHSSGCRLALDILPRIGQRVAGLYFLAPVIDLHFSDQAIIKLGIAHLEKNNNKLASKLRFLSDNLTVDFDDNRSEALAIAFSSGFYEDYFASSESYEDYYRFFKGEYAFNLKQYLSLRKGIPRLKSPHSQYGVPCTAFFGSHDPAVDAKHQTNALARSVSPLHTIILDDVAHYPHIDKQAIVFDQIRSELEIRL